MHWSFSKKVIEIDQELGDKHRSFNYLNNIAELNLENSET